MGISRFTRKDVINACLKKRVGPKVLNAAFFSPFMMDKKQCDISVEPHPVLGDIYVVKGDCVDKIKAINANQGPYKKKSFNRRLVFPDDSSKPRLKTSIE